MNPSFYFWLVMFIKSVGNKQENSPVEGCMSAQNNTYIQRLKIYAKILWKLLEEGPYGVH